jgi:hypothetical protein
MLGCSKKPKSRFLRQLLIFFQISQRIRLEFKNLFKKNTILKFQIQLCARIYGWLQYIFEFDEKIIVYLSFFLDCQPDVIGLVQFFVFKNDEIH